MTRTMRERAAELGITLRTRYDGTHVDDDGWTHDLYRVTLRCDGRSMSTEYRMGMGHAGRRPKVWEVLSSLVDDAASADQTFDDWCADYGYDTDSRRAYASWQACGRIRRKLTRVVGSDALELLTNETERD